MDICITDSLCCIASTLKKLILKKSTRKIKKCLQITNVGEGVEKMEPLYTVGGNVNWSATMEIV